jgi:hypothetical protein
MSTTHSELVDIAKRRCNRSPKIARKIDKEVTDELFTRHQDVRVDFTAFDSPECCADRICRTCGNDHDFRPDFRDTRTSIDVIPQILQAKK